MGRHFAPLWIPVGAVLFAAVVIYGLSRVLLSFSRGTAPIVALIIALAILGIAALVASRVTSAEDAG